MSRFNAPQMSEYPFHITSRTPNRVDFPLPMHRIWSILSDELYMAHKKYGFQIISFVLMPNHFHLLGRTSEYPLGCILNDLMRDSSKRMNFESGRINQNWGSVAYRTEISNLNYYYNVYRYVYQNPLRAQLCERAEDYPFSTLNGLLGKLHVLIPVQEDLTLFTGNLESNLTWINSLQTREQTEYIKMGLKYKTFKLKKDSARRILLQPDAPPTHK